MASRGTPTVFWLLFVTALLVGGLAAVVGFAIHDEVTDDESESLVTSEAACLEIEQFFPDDPENAEDQCRDVAAEDGADGQDGAGDGEEPPPPPTDVVPQPVQPDTRLPGGRRPRPGRGERLRLAADAAASLTA